MRPKKVRVTSLASLGKSLRKVVGKKELSEKELLTSDADKFKCIFAKSFYSKEPWLARAYAEGVESKRSLGEISISKLVKSGRAKDRQQAMRLIAKKLPGIKKRGRALLKVLFKQRAENPTVERQIAYHLIRAFVSSTNTTWLRFERKYLKRKV